MKKVILSLIAWVIVIVWSLPLVGMIAASVQPTAVVGSEGWWTFAKITLDNYNYVLSKGFAQHMWYSAIITLSAVAIPVAVSALLAYGLARFSFRLKTYLFLLLVMLQTLPQIVVVVPLLLLKRAFVSDPFSLANLAWIIFVHSAFAVPWIVLFMYNFLKALPKDYEEAALVDGLSHVGVLFRVVFPVLRPAITSIMIIQFIWVWHDLLFAVVFLPQQFWPATAAVTTFVSRYNPNWGALTASSTLTSLVPIAVYAAMYKKYMSALAGGLKA